LNGYAKIKYIWIHTSKYEFIWFNKINGEKVGTFKYNDLGKLNIYLDKLM